MTRQRAALIVLCVTGSSAGARGESLSRSWSFDDDPAGRPPAGWSIAYTGTGTRDAKWTVEKDVGQPANILRLHARSGRPVYNVAMAVDTSLRDVDVRTRLRPDSGEVDQGGGVIWRCRDADNYYICRFNPLESNFRVYRVVNGKREQLQSADVKTESGRWYEVRAVMVGDHITCYLDGRKLLDVWDDTFKGPGMIGLWTKADASSSFDDVSVRSPADRATTTQPSDK
jgi:hypothetical protein